MRNKFVLAFSLLFLRECLLCDADVDSLSLSISSCFAFTIKNENKFLGETGHHIKDHLQSHKR